MKVPQLCPTLCDRMDCIVHGILQARILEWVAFPYSRNLPNPGIEPRSPALQADSLPDEPQRGVEVGLAVCVKVTQSCLTLCDPMDYTVHGIHQARILEWVAFAFSRASSEPRDRTQVFHIAGGFFTS